MKRAYLADGVLTKDAQVADNTLTVDSALYNYISGLLGADYCYLTLGSEIVKVLDTQAPNTLLVSRAVGGIRKSHLAGQRIVYTLSANELADATIASALTLTASGALELDVNNLAYPQIKIFTFGGITADGMLIQDIPDNAGCCAGDTNPPTIPPQYKKLRIITSGKYRQVSSGNIRAYL